MSGTSSPHVSWPIIFIHRFSTRDTLQDTARLQFEINKKSRKNVFVQAAERGNEWGGLHAGNAPPVPPKMMRSNVPRMRSGSGTSRTTATSDSDSLAPGPQSHSSFSPSSSPSQPSIRSTSLFHNQQLPSHHTQVPAMNSTATTLPVSSPAPPSNPASALSPIANRMRERDADAIEKYLRRNRSGSQGTSSTENKSQNGSNYSSVGPTTNEDISTLNYLPTGGSTTPRRLRPSFSAMQLRSETPSNGIIHVQPDSRNRAGTNPARPSPSPLPLLTRSSSTSNSPHSLISPNRSVIEETESYIGPPSQYAQFPDPPLPIEDSTMPTAGRRKAFHLLSKPLPSLESSGTSHRRGMSANSVR